MDSSEAEQFRIVLGTVIAGESFVRSPALGRLLTYLVEQVLAGQAASLKESWIGHDLYRRRADYDPKVDAIVRVSASRLRIRLEEHYRTNPGKGWRIMLPKGSYVPLLEVQEETPASEVFEPESGRVDDTITETLLLSHDGQRGAPRRNTAATWLAWFSRSYYEIALVALPLGIALLCTIYWTHMQRSSRSEKAQQFMALSSDRIHVSPSARGENRDEPTEVAVAPPTARPQTSSVPRNSQAQILYMNGVQQLRGLDPVVASQLLERSIALEPEFALAHSELSHALILMGQDDRGLEEAHRGQALAHHLSKVDQLRVKAVTLAAEHQYEEAAATYGELFALVPQDLEYVRSQASLLKDAGHDQETVRLLEPLADDRSRQASLPAIYLTMGQAYNNLGNAPAALHWARKAKDKAKQNGNLVLYERAHTAEAYPLDELGYSDEALKKASEAVELATRFGDKTGALQALVAKAEIQNGMGKLKEARVILLQVLQQAKALGQTQRQINALTALGRNYIRLGDTRQGLTYYQQSLDVALSFHQPSLIHAAEFRVAELQSKLGPRLKTDTSSQ